MDFSELQKLQTELEQKTARKSGLPQEKNPENPKSGNQEIPIPRKEETPKGENPESLKTRNQDKIKVPKYYTQVPIALQDEIKIYAVRHKLDDYEVVILALEAFLKKQK